MSDVLRRDPRIEWIKRNRLHPEHAVYAAPQAEVRGPTGLLRKNPHAVGFIGPNGIKRIDRLAGNAADTGAGRRKSAQVEEQLPLHSVASPDFYIAVVPDLPGGFLSSHDKDVIGQAHGLARQIEAQEGNTGAVLVVTFGEHQETHFDTAGADRLIELNSKRYEGFAPEARLSALQAIESHLHPYHWLFPDSVMGGFDLGCRLSAALNERAATQVWKASEDHIIARINGQTQDAQRTTPRLLLLSAECHDPIDETRHEALRLALDEVGLEHLLDETNATSTSIKDLGSVDVDPNAIPLAEAPFILAGGNGITDWDQFHTAAAVLGATEGASRVAVDDGFMPRSRQVGATGTWVTADVYLAVGISGAIQHLQGIGQCRTVIAVNTDAGCDMVKRADLSLIIESQVLLDALNQELAKRFPERQPALPDVAA
jgi:electron transfer flavoprotein alpha subunit